MPRIMKPEISLNKPHARSAFAHLPLAGFGDGELTRITNEDRAAYAERPITLTTFGGSAFPADTVSEKARVKARSLFLALNVNDETPAAGMESVPCAEGKTHEFLRAASRLNGSRYAPTHHWIDSEDNSVKLGEGFLTTEKGHRFECANCRTEIMVGMKRIASTPAIPCPYAARNRREDKLDRMVAVPVLEMAIAA